MAVLAVTVLVATGGGGAGVAVAQEAKTTAQPAAATRNAAEALPGARPGECFAKVFVPAQYKTVTEEVVIQEASEKIEVVPAKWEWVEEKVLIKPASTELVPVAAVFEKTTEKVEISPAHTVWRTGSSDKATIADAALTGSALALGIPATAKVGECYAEYVIPAEYKTVRTRKLASPATEKRTAIPAKTEVVTKRVKIADGKLEWRPILCEVNMSKDIVLGIQRALKAAGYDPGPIDGMIGNQTMTAVNANQRAKGLAAGGLTIDTTRALGVKI